MARRRRDAATPVTTRPDPVAMRVAARQLFCTVRGLEHEVTLVRRSASRLHEHWTGGAALQHATAAGEYLRGLETVAQVLRNAAQHAAATAARLDWELIELDRLQARPAVVGGSPDAAAERSAAGSQVEEVWSRIRAHQRSWALAMDQIELPGQPDRRMRCGPVHRPDLGGRRMRTGPVHRVVDAWVGRGGHQVISVERPVIAS